MYVMYCDVSALTQGFSDCFRPVFKIQDVRRLNCHFFLLNKEVLSLHGLHRVIINVE